MKLNPETPGYGPIPKSVKIPVVAESYNEIVFTEPFESFLARVHNHPAVHISNLPDGFNLPPPGTFLFLVSSEATVYFQRHDDDHCCCNVAGVAETYHLMIKGDTKDHPLSQWFLKFSETDELLKLTALRQKVSAAQLKFSLFRFTIS